MERAEEVGWTIDLRASLCTDAKQSRVKRQRHCMDRSMKGMRGSAVMKSTKSAGLCSLGSRNSEWGNGTLVPNMAGGGWAFHARWQVAHSTINEAGEGGGLEGGYSGRVCTIAAHRRA